MTSLAAPRTSSWHRIGFWAFIVLMAALTALFITLGVWQLERLGEKEALIAAVEERLELAPVPLPAVADWPAMPVDDWNFRPVSLTGHFVHGQSIMVFTALSSSAKGQYSGAGYWLVTPFALDTGGTVLVNRGFLPQDMAATYDSDVTGSESRVTITGLARTPEEANDFTPAADAANRIEWVRNPERMTALLDPALAPIAPITVDLPSQGAGVLPQGGETVVSFPNKHLEYAGTWFCFAAITPIMLIFWIMRQRRNGRKVVASH